MRILPFPGPSDAFLLDMRAVKVAQASLIDGLARGWLSELSPVGQDRVLELRYSRKVDFTNEIWRRFSKTKPSPEAVEARLHAPDVSLFLHPFINPEAKTEKSGAS